MSPFLFLLSQGIQALLLPVEFYQICACNRTEVSGLFFLPLIFWLISTSLPFYRLFLFYLTSSSRHLSTSIFSQLITFELFCVIFITFKPCFSQKLDFRLSFLRLDAKIFTNLYNKNTFGWYMWYEMFLQLTKNYENSEWMKEGVLSSNQSPIISILIYNCKKLIIKSI